MEKVIEILTDRKKVTYKRLPSGTCYHWVTPEEVFSALEIAMKSSRGMRVRVFYGDAKTTGRDWLDEFDVVGYVGRSTGRIKVPLLLRTKKSMGGSAILDHCILRLLLAGREVYRHPKYHLPSMGIMGSGEMVKDEYVTRFWVTVEGKEHATFATYKQAERWLAFMKGERMTR